VPTLAVLLLLGAPFLHVRFNAPDSTILPPSVASRSAFDRLAAAFGEGEFAPLTLAIRTDGPATDPENVARLFDYSRRLAADPRVTRVESLVDIDPRIRLDQYQLLYGDPNGPRDRYLATAVARTTAGDLTAFTVYTRFGPNRDEGRALVADLRSGAGALAAPAGMEVLVGGGAADVTDVVGRVAADFPRTALFIVVTTYIVLFLLLRSAVLPLKALVMNTLSILASFGALVWIFQDGNLSALLGFEPLGFVETTQPVILFCVLFGLSMDYEVFLLSRMKEIWDRTGDNQEAVARGLERSGRIVTSAALVVVVVAGSFALADIVLIKALGIGMALAVALDATVVRALLVPATMRLLGRWNWWAPHWVRRVPVVGTTLLLVAAPLLGGCAAGPILANAPALHPTTPPRSAQPRASTAPDPRPVRLPADDAPHDRLTEWWYYTGHLREAADGSGNGADDGAEYGFEFVFFRVERGEFPVGWASHFAITDEGRNAFHDLQRVAFGPQVNIGEPGRSGFRFQMSAEGANWEMDGNDGHDILRVDTTPVEAAAAGSPGGLGIELMLDARKPPALHDGDGWIDFGAGGSSYYYSRTAISATGSLTLGQRTFEVTGDAWFDHQWGDFIAVGGGGWDWFAINLADGTDLMLSLNRDVDGSYPIVYGTLVDAAGRTRHLQREAFDVTITDRWLSPLSGADYPARWRITIPEEDLQVELRPTVAAQELDTRATTGVYWEGSQHVEASRGGVRIGGEAYVELTGYGPAGTGEP
jgi:predicted secreted hydrolase